VIISGIHTTYKRKRKRKRKIRKIFESDGEEMRGGTSFINDLMVTSRRRFTCKGRDRSKQPFFPYLLIMRDHQTSR
jgi:hypothetical protein